MSSRLQRAAVIGGGYMGGGIAQALAIGGLDCVVSDATKDLAQSAVRRLQEEARQYEASGLFPSGSHERVMDHLLAAPSLEAAVSGADYITEAIPENADLKREVLARISKAADPGAVIGSNTSAIPIGELGKVVDRPERFLGVHWMNPAFFVPCVEIIPIEATDEQVVEDVSQLLHDIGKAPSRVSDSPGFVANRLQYALFKECTRLVEEGIAEPARIDEVVRNSFGFRLPFFGPFAIADIAGLDVYVGAYDTMEAAYGERMAVPQSLKERVDSARLGVKSGAGFYRFEENQPADIALYRDEAYSRLGELRTDLEQTVLLSPLASPDNS